MDPIYRGQYPQDLWDTFGYQVPRVAMNDLETISAPIDFLGVNYYTRGVVRHAPGAFLDYETTHPAGEYTAMDWEVYPQGLTDLLLRLHADWDVGTLYVTENGCAYEDTLTADGRVHDASRTAYLRAHLAACCRAIEAGVPLRGYFLWSLLDNFEWALGYSRRFGIVYVDVADQKRIEKDSARFYSTVVHSNRVESPD
jgi:beta-glucosidase